MQLIAAHDGKLLTLNASLAADAVGKKTRAFSSGLAELDAMAPFGAFARGAIHEVLTEPADGKAVFFATMLARGALGETSEQDQQAPSPDDAGAEQGADGRGAIGHGAHGHGAIGHGAIVWADPARELYPPALAGHGIALDQLFLLHPTLADADGQEMNWAIAECLRCRGVRAVAAAPGRLSRLQARRFQLAAEAGGAVGLFMRHVGKTALHHAAATRWLVRPAPGSRTIQRWTIQLIHGHGGQVGKSLCLEHCRETNHVRTTVPVADRPSAKEPAIARAS